MTPLERIEQRSEPRYRHFLTVRIGSLETTTANVSLHGMQLVCPHMRFKHIKAGVESGQLGGQIVLPQGAPVEATLSVRYWSQHGDEFLVGVRLAVADPGAQVRWAAHIDELSRGVRLTAARPKNPWGQTP